MLDIKVVAQYNTFLAWVYVQKQFSERVDG